MANRVQTLVEPTATELRAITVLYDAGTPKSVQVVVVIKTLETGETQTASQTFQVSDLASTVQTALTNFGVAALNRIKTLMGF